MTRKLRQLGISQHGTRGRVAAASFVLLGLAGLAASLGYGGGAEGESAAPASQNTAAAASPSAADAAKPRAEPRGRLPVYFRNVVTPEQRDRIYAIQRSYAEQMEPLREQLAELEEQMHAEVRGVLSDEQRRRVDDLVAKARARREQSRGTDTGADTVGR